MININSLDIQFKLFFLLIQQERGKSMGRPIKKKFFGIPASLYNERMILTKAWLHGEVGPSDNFFILSQKGTGRYKVTNGIKTGIVRLVDGDPTEAGEASVEVTVFNQVEKEFARVIHNRTVKTYAGKKHRWSFDVASEEVTAQLPSEEFMSEEEVIVAINDATNADDMFDVMTQNMRVVFTPESMEMYENIPTSGTSRQKAIAGGLLEWFNLFGHTDDINVIHEYVDLHTVTEFHKANLIAYADSATDMAALKDVFITHLAPMVNDRNNLIVYLKDDADNVAANTRAGELEVEDFTVVFNDLMNAMNDVGTDMDALFTAIFNGRQGLSNSKFFGTARMLPIIVDALDAL